MQAKSCQLSTAGFLNNTWTFNIVYIIFLIFNSQILSSDQSWNFYWSKQVKSELL